MAGSAATQPESKPTPTTAMTPGSEHPLFNQADPRLQLLYTKGAVKVVIGPEEYQENVLKIAQRIKDEYEAADPAYKESSVLLTYLANGGTFFGTKLAEALQSLGISVDWNTLGVSSYGTQMESKGTVEFRPTFSPDAPENTAERLVFIVDDLVESGLSLHQSVAFMRKNFPNAIVRSVAFGNKHTAARESRPGADIYGVEFNSTAWLVGAGLDAASKKGSHWRALNYILAVTDVEAYQVVLALPAAEVAFILKAEKLEPDNVDRHTANDIFTTTLTRIRQEGEQARGKKSAKTAEACSPPAFKRNLTRHDIHKLGAFGPESPHAGSTFVARKSRVLMTRSGPFFASRPETHDFRPELPTDADEFEPT